MCSAHGRLTRIVRETEREACARIADGAANAASIKYRNIAQSIAAEIRARL
jgi:hypothetical protein